VTDEEMIAQYAASEEKRKQGREDKGKEIVPDVPPDQLQVTLCAQLLRVTVTLDYRTCVSMREDSQLDGRDR
jgi:hypothetical protein